MLFRRSRWLGRRGTHWPGLAPAPSSLHSPFWASLARRKCSNLDWPAELTSCARSLNWEQPFHTPPHPALNCRGSCLEPLPGTRTLHPPTKVPSSGHPSLSSATFPAIVLERTEHPAWPSPYSCVPPVTSCSFLLPRRSAGCTGRGPLLVFADLIVLTEALRGAVAKVTAHEGQRPLEPGTSCCSSTCLFLCSLTGGWGDTQRIGLLPPGHSALPTSVPVFTFLAWLSMELSPPSPLQGWVLPDRTRPCLAWGCWGILGPTRAWGTGLDWHAWPPARCGLSQLPFCHPALLLSPSRPSWQGWDPIEGRA